MAVGYSYLNVEINIVFTVAAVAVGYLYLLSYMCPVGSCQSVR